MRWDVRAVLQDHFVLAARISQIALLVPTGTLKAELPHPIAYPVLWGTIVCRVVVNRLRVPQVVTVVSLGLLVSQGSKVAASAQLVLTVLVGII